MLVEGYEIELRLRKKLGEGAQKWMNEICRAAPRADAGARGHWSLTNPGTGMRYLSGMKSFDARLYSDQWPQWAASPAIDVLYGALGSWVPGFSGLRFSERSLTLPRTRLRHPGTRPIEYEHSSQDQTRMRK